MRTIYLKITRWAMFLAASRRDWLSDESLDNCSLFFSIQKQHNLSGPGDCLPVFLGGLADAPDICLPNGRG